MNIWEINKLILFLAFVIPGFITIKTYDLLIPSVRRDSSKTLIDAVTYSCLNYSFLSWLIMIDQTKQWGVNYPTWHNFLVFFVLFLSPTIWAIVFVCLRKWSFIRKYIPHPTQKPWDYVFGNGQSYWVIVELKSGETIGGMYDTKSFTSSYPDEEQIYLQQLWEIGYNNRFMQPIKDSHGAIISTTEITYIHLYRKELLI